MTRFRGEVKEGLDPFTKAAGLMLLRYVAGGHKEFREMITLIRSASTYFEHTLRKILNGPRAATYDELLELGVMKKKYIPYAAYMATISTYPLLVYTASKSQILSTILAKMALILSIKVLDNINDTYHSLEEAAQSLDRQAKAIANGEFHVLEGTDIVKKAENSCLLMGLLVNYWLRNKVPNANITRKLFLLDLKKYIEGQCSTFKQQDKDARVSLSIYDYLRAMNEKGVGRVWVGLDLCMLENTSLKTSQDYRVVIPIRKAFDYIFKSSNYYDDVADLEADLKAGIWNSVVYLGKDLRLIASPQDAVKNNALKRYTIRLGDLHYLMGLQFLNQASKHIAFRCSSLKASMHVFRYFTVRKWLLKSKNPLNLIDFLGARAPPELLRYAEFIKG
ncbi:MAG: hypothetical protein QW470_04805 [Candidatus Caldarchaeum sp.]